VFSPGNTHDSKMFNRLYDKMERKPGRIYGDSAYDTCEIRGRLWEGWSPGKHTCES